MAAKKRAPRGKKKPKKVRQQKITSSKMGGTEICLVFGISKVTLNTWCKNGCPRRSTGSRFVYDAAKVFTWRLRHQKELDKAVIKPSPYAEDSEKKDNEIKAERLRNLRRVNDQKDGRLVAIDIVAELFGDLGGILRAYVESLGRKHGRKARKDGTAMIERMQREFGQAFPKAAPPKKKPKKRGK